MRQQAEAQGRAVQAQVNQELASVLLPHLIEAGFSVIWKGPELGMIDSVVDQIVPRNPDFGTLGPMIRIGPR